MDISYPFCANWYNVTIGPFVYYDYHYIFIVKSVKQIYMLYHVDISCSFCYINFLIKLINQIYHNKSTLYHVDISIMTHDCQTTILP